MRLPFWVHPKATQPTQKQRFSFSLPNSVGTSIDGGGTVDDGADGGVFVSGFRI